MSRISAAITVCLFFALAACAAAEPIKVCVKARGNTGLEQRVENILGRELSSAGDVSMVKDREECHLYIDLALVEQEPIRFYALGVSIAYHIRDKFYSRPTADVAQFGEERMEEICVYLAGEIDKGFLEPLRASQRKTGSSS
ncbi:MAG: hypothetical protein GF408_01630 [Candidatus Omnitrophica bacterium]|nr:hypothetical protein [Candidatus Omnitrophota bacterium]